MPNWLAAILAIGFFFGFIFVMKNRKKIAEFVKDKFNKIGKE